MEKIYLGPMGRLVSIDIPTGGYKHDFVEYGSEHVPLSGLRTKDILAIRHEFEIDTDGLTPRALSWFRALYTEAIPGPLYLRESTETNLLRLRVANTSSTPASLPNSTDWTIPGGGDVVASVVATNAILSSPIPGEETTFAPARALSWVSAGANRTISDAILTPVLPGEKLCFSTYVQSGTPTLEIVPYNAALAPQTAITGTTIVAGTPPRRYVGYTVPTNGTIVAVAVQLRQATAGTTITHAWQLEPGRLDPSAWRQGLGVPKVMFTGNMGGDRHAIGPYTSGTYTFKEL
jgi:hypothetical protein